MTAGAGVVRPARRPPGWVVPGPPPAARADVVPRRGEDLCYLSGDWRIFQRLDCHRWSLDDLVTAGFAAGRASTPTARIADLGCGIGSVVLMLAWRFPGARLVGVEAQQTSVDLARRSVAWNGADARVEIRHGDLRDASVVPEAGAFDLVTGTPPYLLPGEDTESRRSQCGPCRFTHRGTIEDYARTAARLLAPDGWFVACEASSRAARVARAAADAGLAIAARLVVVPKAGKAPLFDVWAMRRPVEAPGVAGPVVVDRLTVRDARGTRTSAFAALRAAMGMP
jgi:tRNA1Val (adenine37-N6)-methyltransferase